MKKKIAVIATEFLKDFLMESLREICVDCDFTIYIYFSFEDIKEIYLQIPSNIEGILTSGVFPEQVIRKNFPKNNLPIVAFNNDDAGIYRLFLSLLEKNRSLNLSRIYADPLAIFGIDLREYLFGDQKLSYSDIIKPIVEKMSLDQINEIEEKEFEKHVSLWKQGEIDVSVTRFSSLVGRLKDSGVNVFFPFPSAQYIKSCCIQLSQEIDVLKMKENQPAVINVSVKDITFSGATVDAAFERRCILLHEALMDYNGNSMIEYVLQRYQFGFEILTDRKNIEEKTNHYTVSSLENFLENRLNFKVCIGYGIGNDMYQARMNAISANRESAIHASGGSFLINENNELRGPLEMDQQITISDCLTDKMKEATQNAKLSPITVRKIVRVFQMMPQGQLTARELAARLAITQRSANRFLSEMEKSKSIAVVDKRRCTTKGRPERVYELKEE